MNLEAAREILIHQSRSKMNGIFPVQAEYQHQMTNPICGDHVQIKFNTKNRTLSEFGFSTKACAICAASTAMMATCVKGLTLKSAMTISKKFENALLAPADEAWPDDILNLKSFEHLKINQARRTCAILPWVVLRAAVKVIT